MQCPVTFCCASLWTLCRGQAKKRLTSGILSSDSEDDEVDLFPTKHVPNRFATKDEQA